MDSVGFDSDVVVERLTDTELVFDRVSSDVNESEEVAETVTDALLVWVFDVELAPLYFDTVTTSEADVDG